MLEEGIQACNETLYITRDVMELGWKFLWKNTHIVSLQKTMFLWNTEFGFTSQDSETVQCLLVFMIVLISSFLVVWMYVT